jgi:hypothetical protein
MEVINVLLPALVVAAAEGSGNRATQNARYRTAVCNHFGLRFHRVGGNGNCFFTSACIALEATLGAGNVPEHLASADNLRASLIRFLRLCVETDEEAEIVKDMREELRFPMQCQTRAEINGVRVHNYQATSLEAYLEAAAFDGVWVSGYHWPIALSVVASVRVAVVIFGHDSVIYFGSEATTTIYLYKVRCAMCDVRCAMCDVRCAMCDVRCAMCDV